MMRTRNILAMSIALMALALTMSGCGTSLTLAVSGNSGAAAYVDDLYGVHDVVALREAERIAAEKVAAAKAEREKRIAAMIAADNAEADIDEILGNMGIESTTAGVAMPSNGGDVNITYNNIYVDDYESAYARRLQGFTSLTYRLPSSYWDYRYGDAYFLTLAYDPAFYTVMVMGDQVWVEPRYITNMFGGWNNPYYNGYRYGYNPYYYGYSYAYWDYWGWNSPYWACDPFYHYHYGWYNPYHYGHPHHGFPHHKPAGPGGPHGDGGHKKPNVTHRPSYGTSGAGGGSSMRPGGGVLSYNDRLGGRDESRGGTQIATGTSGTTNRGTANVSGSSARPTRGTVSEIRNGVGTSTTTRTDGGKVNKPTSKNELSGTLNGSTITARPNSTRGNATSGVSNSSSRSSRGTSSTVRSGSSSSSAKRSSSVKSSSSSSKRSSSSVSRSSSSSSRSSSSSSTSRGSISSGRSSSSGSGSFSRGSSSSSSSRSSSSRSGR